MSTPARRVMPANRGCGEVAFGAAKLGVCVSDKTFDPEPFQSVFVVVVVVGTSDPAVLGLVVETGMLMGPPDGQNAHIEARVSARGGILKSRAIYRIFLLVMVNRKQIIL